MPHSHHAHSGQFCRHAKDTLEDVVDEAVRKGFKVFGLTEHAPRYRPQDLYPEESDLNPSDLARTYDAFLVEAKRIRASRSDISLLIGIESDYITELDADGLGDLLDRNDEIDYVVGSVHHANGIPLDFDRETWLKSVHSLGDAADPPSPAELGPFTADYLDKQFALMQRHQPEVIGHFDLCLLYTPSISLKDCGVWDRVQRNVQYAISYGALFEANAAAIRKGWKTSYPGPDVLQLILSLGGRVCLSDDSHGTAFVGLNYAKMRAYLLSSGVTEVWYLVHASQRQKGDEVVGKRGRVVARRSPDWAEDKFWDALAKATATE